MSESLPPRPNLDWLKNRAKDRLAVLRAADPSAKRADALLAVARDYGFQSWRELKTAVEKVRTDPGFGRLGFVAFPVADLVRTRHFYQSQLSMTVLSSDATSVDFSFAGIRLRAYLHAGDYRPQHSGLQVLVTDLETRVGAWRSLGIEFRGDIRHEPWGGRAITIADPDGNLFDAVDDSYAGRLETPPDPEAEKRVLNDFRRAIKTGNAAELGALLETEPVAVANVNAPVFEFDSRPIIIGRRHREIVDLLLAYGADINLRSAWWAGGFGVLDHTDPATAEYLISRGAVVDIFAAAQLDRLDRVRELLDAEPELVNSKGGDGGRPLHFARSIEMIDLLLDRGAEIDARDVDHEGTPAQWMVPRPPGASTDDMLLAQGTLTNVRHLADCGAAVDVFMAAALNDAVRLGRMLDENPLLVDCQVGAAGIPLCPKAPGDHQYVYTLGRGKTPLEVATAFNATTTITLLNSRSTPRQRLLSACSVADAGAVAELLRVDPGLVASLSVEEQNRLPTAGWSGDADAVKLMLDVGFNPAVLGPDNGGTALHGAAWHGRAATVEMILDHPAVKNRLTELLAIRDGNFKATPLDWCCHGSTNCRNPIGEYGRVAQMLKDVGGTAEHNSADASPEVRAVLSTSRDQP